MKSFDSSKQLRLHSPLTLQIETTAHAATSISVQPVSKHLCVGGKDIAAEDAKKAVTKDMSSSPPVIIKRAASKSRKRKRTTSSNKEIPTLINLVKQKPTVKSPMFMNSTSSIFAAVCKCDSMLQSLCCDDINAKSHDCILAIIDDHFGACPIFNQTFETTLEASHKSSSPSNTIIEQILHTSTRHLCSNECFLRAYLPVREFCLLWRDMTIHESIGRTKEQLLHEWRCRLVPQKSQVSRLTKKDHKRNSSMSIVYVSPSGDEYKTKSSVIKFLNRIYCQDALEKTPLKQSPLKVKGVASSNNIRIVSPTKCSGLRNVLIQHTINLNPLFSPLGLLEELFVNNPWRLLVSTICLNVTTRRQVDSILHAFLELWPTAEATANADWEEISAIISPMGLGIKRAKGLVRFSTEYIELTKDYDEFSLSEKQVTGLFFCGLYSWSAYKIFIRGELPTGPVRVCDHALQLYVEYQLGRRRECRRADEGG